MKKVSNEKNELLDYQKKLELFDSEESYEFLQMAYSAENKEEAIKYAQKAVDIYDNIDAKLFLIELKENPSEKVREYEELIEQEEKKLKKEKYFEKDCIGDFWLIFETRTYMKMMSLYIQNLIKLRKYDCAIEKCEEMLYLCNNDNLGIRYILVILYAVKNDLEKAEKLCKQFKDNSVAMILPIAFCAYEREDYIKVKEYIDKGNKYNKNLIPYLNGKKRIDDKKALEIFNDMEGYFEIGSIEEIAVALDGFNSIISDRMDYFKWLENNLSLKNGKSK